MNEEYKNYSNHVYDLSILRTDIPIDLQGGNIKVLAVTGNCYLKLNDKSQDPINLLHVNNIKGKFEKLYISNNIQVGCYVAFIVSRPDLELTTNITRDAFINIPLPTQNIPQHLIGRAIDRPAIINIWDIENAKFRHSFRDATQNIGITGLSFNNSGSKLYIAGRIQVPPTNAWTGKIFEYDLGKIWDISTATFKQSFNVNAQVNNPVSLSFNNDGTLMFILNNEINQLIKYALSINWDISTATHMTSVVAPTDNVFCTHFSPLGNKLYLGNFTTNNIMEYDLTTPWDITTAVLKNSLDISPFISWPIGIFLSPDGLKVYIIDFLLDRIIGYRLFNPWDISSGVFHQSFVFRETLTAPRMLYFRPDRKKLYLGSINTNHIYEFDL